MRKIICLLVLLLAGALVAQERLIADIDFNRHSGFLTIREKGSYIGPMPENMMQDFTGWSPGVCNAEPKTDTLGDAYLQFEIQKPGVQFSIALPGLQAKKFYKATFVVYNRLSGSVNAYLRQRYKPYRQPGVKFPLPLGSKFTTCTFPFSPQTVYDSSNPPGLFLHFSHTGVIGFKRIRVEEVSRQEYELLEMETMQRVIRKPTGSANFLRNSSLPRGLQSGWCQLARNHQARSIVESDPAVTGPSGEVALKLDSSTDEEVGIYSEPFTASHPQKPVTVSFSYKGSGTFSAQVISNVWTALGRTALSPVPDVWRRASMTVRLPIRRLAAVLKIQGKGKLYVDAFRVAEQGETEYKPSGEYEVSLFLPDSDASISRIQFEDEAPLLHYYITGNADGVVLKSSVTDLYGTTYSLPDSKGKNGTLRYCRGGKPYGQFRIEVQAFRNGKPVSVVNEMVVTRLPRPVYWGKDAPDSPFGIHTNLLESSIRAMKAGGFNWVRLHDGAQFLSCWYFVEPKKGKWTFADKEIKALRDNHFLLYGQLGGAPAWATELRNLPGFWNEYSKVYFTPLPEHGKEFAGYCETMARRYRGVIDDWFIWNEPWLPLFFHKSFDSEKKTYITFGSVADNAKAYVHLSKLAYTGAKKGNPRCRITGFNSRTSSPEWNTAVYAAGGYAFCDEVDYHVYNQNSPAGFPGDGLEEKMKSAFSEILRKEGGLTKSYIMSEGQAGSAAVEESDPRTGLYKHTIPWHSLEDYHRVADSSIRFLLSHLSFGVKRIFLYSSHVYSQLGHGSELQIMLGADGYPHPGLVAMSAFAKRIEGKKFIRYHKLAEGVFAALFSDGKRTAAVFTGDPRRKAEISCSGIFPYQCSDLYGNTVPSPVYNGCCAYLTANVPPEELASALHLKQRN